MMLKLKVGVWNIAFRKRSNNDTLLNNTNNPFTVIKDIKSGWYADPFLFEHNGKVYLFAEKMSYKHGRGIITYSEYIPEINKFSKFKDIIIEDYHLSYPNVFLYNNEVYIMPESNQSNTLYLYKAVDFPHKWEKLEPLMTNIKLVDTTILKIDNKIYALSYCIDSEPGKLLLLEFNGKEFIRTSQNVVSDDIATARPGGNCFYNNKDLIRVSQDCCSNYGKAINFIKIDDNFDIEYKESIIKKISPQDIRLHSKKNHNFTGMHTYNFVDSLEVIDLKRDKHSIRRLLYRIFG